MVDDVVSCCETEGPVTGHGWAPCMHACIVCKRKYLSVLYYQKVGFVNFVHHVFVVEK